MLAALNVSVVEFALAGMTICLAVALQSAAGFGSGLVAIPPLVWLGIPLPKVVALVSTVSIVQSSLGAHNLRASVPWRISLTAVGVMIGLPIGNRFEKERLRQVAYGLLFAVGLSAVVL